MEANSRLRRLQQEQDNVTTERVHHIDTRKQRQNSNVQYCLLALNFSFFDYVFVFSSVKCGRLADDQLLVHTKKLLLLVF